MISFLKQIYLTTFVMFFKFAFRWGTTVRTGLATACLAALEWVFLVGITSCIDLHLGKKFLLNLPKWLVAVIFFGLCLANHYSLVTYGKGPEFLREFASLKKAKQILLLSCSALAILGIMGFFLYFARLHRQLPTY